MDNHDLFLTLELMRALGVDVKTPGELVYPDELRPSVRYMLTTDNTGIASVLPSFSVVVPEGQRWIIDTVSFRVFDQNVGRQGYLYATVRENEMGQLCLDGGPENPLRNSGADVGSLTTIAAKRFSTSIKGLILPQQAFSLLIGADSNPPIAGISDEENAEFTVDSYVLYAGSEFTISSDQDGDVTDMAELAIRIRYRVFTEHFLNFICAKLQFKDDNPDAGVWGIDTTP